MGSEANRKKNYTLPLFYTFPPQVMAYLGKVVPADIVGEFHVEYYGVSLNKFCIVLHISLC